MRHAYGAIPLILALIVAIATPASADPITFDQWYNFRTEAGVGDDFPPGLDLGAGAGFAVGHSSFEPFYFAPGDPPWTFTAPAQGATLTVLDGGEYGDVYDVFDFDSYLGATSPVDLNLLPLAPCGDTPQECVDTGWSQGSFFLGPGDHSITIAINDTIYPTSNLSWFIVTAAGEGPPPGEIPEPDTMALLAGGFLVLGALGHRRRVRNR